MSHFTHMKTRFQNLFYLEKALNRLNLVHKQEEIENQINLMHVYIEKTSHHSTREKLQLYNSGKIGTDYRFKSLRCYEMTYFEISKYLMTHMKALRMYR